MNFVLKSGVHQFLRVNNLSRVVDEGFSVVADKIGRGAMIDFGKAFGGLDINEITLDANAIFLLNLDGVSQNYPTTI